VRAHGTSYALTAHARGELHQFDSKGRAKSSALGSDGEMRGGSRGNACFDGMDD